MALSMRCLPKSLLYLFGRKDINGYRTNYTDGRASKRRCRHIFWPTTESWMAASSSSQGRRISWDAGGVDGAKMGT